MNNVNLRREEIHAKLKAAGEDIEPEPPANEFGYQSMWKGHFCDEDGVGQYADPSVIMVKEQQITLTYDYPLSNPVRKTHTTTNPAGWTREELCNRVMRDYAKIYEEEKESMKGPESNIPGMMNRAQSDGVHGIWGHSMSDLILHTLCRKKDGTYTVELDS